MSRQSAHLRFRDCWIKGETLFGTFLKTPTLHATETLGSVGFDFVVVDQEHAPIGKEVTDQILMAARASGIAGIVRVPDASAASILSALDCGAAGVLVPHVDSPAKARAVAAACRYHGGARGYSNSTRAGGYGALSIGDHVAAQDAAVAVIAMIEDPQAIDSIAQIASVDGIDGFFIGRGDLTVAYGLGPDAAQRVNAATSDIIKAASKVGKPTCVMAANAVDAAEMSAKGVSAFILSSDQGFLRQAASSALAEMQAYIQLKDKTDV
jgi:staphyloferrin B biosynthesis citrate synthase